MAKEDRENGHSHRPTVVGFLVIPETATGCLARSMAEAATEAADGLGGGINLTRTAATTTVASAIASAIASTGTGTSAGTGTLARGGGSPEVTHYSFAYGRSLDNFGLGINA